MAIKNTEVHKAYKITKRDGRIVDFQIEKITNAIKKSFAATKGNISYEYCLSMAEEVFETFTLNGGKMANGGRNTG